MQIFLTGATGFIGRALSRKRIDRGWQVTALVRDTRSPQARALTELGVKCLPGDVTDSTSLLTAMQGAELVIHNAGHYEYGVTKAGRERMQAVNVRGTANVLDAARQLSVPKTVYVSSVVAYGASGDQPRDETFIRQTVPNTFYERTKTEAHDLAVRLQREGSPIVIVCPNGVIGANDHSAWGYTLRLYLSGLRPPVSWSPASVFPLVDVDDVAEGVVLAAERGRVGESYFLSGEPKSFREHFELWQLRPGRFKVRAYLPSPFMAALYAPFEPLQRRLGLPAFASRELVRAAAMSLYYKSDKAKQELGWHHLGAEEMWLKTIDGELELLKRRKKRDLVSRLRPIDEEHAPRYRVSERGIS